MRAHPGSRRTRVETSAHRGDSSRYRENTLPAIRSAIAAGADFVEVDVRVTADGAVVLIHDPDLNRLWGRPADVSGTTLAEIRELGERDHRPPLLAEALELFSDTPVTLLIDMEDPAVAEPAFRVVGPGRTNLAWCGAIGAMHTIRALDPAARIWLPWDRPEAPTASELAELAPERLNADLLTVTADLVDQVHALGVKVAVWTVDDESSMSWAMKIGVDTVTTNQLGRLQRLANGSPGSHPATPTGQDQGESAAGDPGMVDLDAALTVAAGLGRWAAEFARSTDPGTIATKLNDADLVTELDVALERHVRGVIAEHFVGHGFVGEELGGETVPGEPTWYLDPIDGTTNLANRIPWNAFSLAAVEAPG